MVFFVGSIFFTSAAALQWLETINADPGPAHRRGTLRVLTFEPRRIDWWSSGVQLVGTVFFNFTTFHALQDGLDAGAYDRLVWRPDALGSVCFLVSGYLAYVEVSGHALWPRNRTLEWKIAAVNLVGCIAFGISAVASFWVPDSGGVLALAASNWFTSLGVASASSSARCSCFRNPPRRKTWSPAERRCTLTRDVRSDRRSRACPRPSRSPGAGASSRSCPGSSGSSCC